MIPVESPRDTAIHYRPIGVIHTPFTEIADMPIQPAGAAGIAGQVEIFPGFSAGLKDLDGFSHIYLLYHFHLVEDYCLTVTPFLDPRPRGLFATRAPKRPNPIGLSIVQLVRIKDNVLHIEEVDIVDGTPLLDVKPYVPKFDHRWETHSGWLERAQEEAKHTRSDERFR